MLISLALFACHADYAITATTLNPDRDTCAFTVMFPDDYVGPERGEQVIEVSAYDGLVLEPLHSAFPLTLEGRSQGIGPILRRTCAGYLLKPEVVAKSE